MKKTYMNNITIVNKNQKKKTFTVQQNLCTTKKILDKIFANQHNSNMKKIKQSQ